MATRAERLASIASTIADYRANELAAPTPEHVDKWVRQFPEKAQRPILRELDHVMKETYIGRGAAEAFLEKVVSAAKLVGADPRGFWLTVNFLDCQESGSSQRDMLKLFGETLRLTHGVDIAGCGSSSGPYIYLDDAIFTGGRVGADLERWIREESPTKATVHVIVMAIHTLSEWQVGRRLREAASAAGKQIEFHYWRSQTVENRKAQKDNSEVLWPVELPEAPEVTAYMSLEHKYPWDARVAGGKLGPFSSEEGRQILEREFLLAGLKIRAAHENPSAILRPLGFSPFGLGFGSMTVTFRNCPNNAPLALWWGNIDGNGPAHFNNWYPLFPRKTYQQGEGGFDVFFS